MPIVVSDNKNIPGTIKYTICRSALPDYQMDFLLLFGKWEIAWPHFLSLQFVIYHMTGDLVPSQSNTTDVDWNMILFSLSSLTVFMQFVFLILIVFLRKTK